MPTGRKTALCLIVLNERKGCEFDLPKIDLSPFDEVFAIDGGSTDGTAEFLRQQGITVHRQQVRSLNAAYWQAVEAATADQIVVFFPKGTLDPAILPAMKHRLDEGYELVIPSRIGKGAQNEEDSKYLRPRKWGIRALALFSSLCWRREGPLLWDVLHGVKGFRKQAFLEMDPARTGVSIDLEMVVRAYRLGLRRCEFPVAEVARPWGHSQFKIIPTGKKLAKYLWREMFRTKPVRGFPQPAVAETAIAKDASG